VTVLAAGVFGVPYRVFLPPFAAASFLYILVFVLLGYMVGPAALQALAGPRLSLRLALTVLIVVGLGVFLGVLYRRAARVRSLRRESPPEVLRLETSALAGLVATLEMAAIVSMALYLLAVMGVLGPEQALTQFLRGAGERFGGGVVRLAALLFGLVVASDFVWAVVYSHLVAPRLRHVPPWLRGLLFSVFPLLSSVLLVMPLLGAGPLGLGVGAGLMPLAGEIVRNAVYGVGLAVSYSLLRAARQLPARAVTS
jgi:hypothetical protein